MELIKGAVIYQELREQSLIRMEQRIPLWYVTLSLENYQLFNSLRELSTQWHLLLLQNLNMLYMIIWIANVRPQIVTHLGLHVTVVLIEKPVLLGELYIVQQFNLMALIEV